MRTTKITLILFSSILVATIGGSLYFSAPTSTDQTSISVDTGQTETSVDAGETEPIGETETIITNPSQGSSPPSGASTPRIKSLSAYGNLTSYKLVLNCTLEKPAATAPTITQINQPITEELAKEIASKVFGISNSKIEKEDDVYSIMLFGNKKEVNYFGLNGLLYYETGLDTVVKDWDPDDMQGIAEKMLNSLKEYWTFDTAASLRLVNIGPCGVSESVSLDGTLESREINSIAVVYHSSVNGIDIEGNGADFFFEIADGRVICAELRMPIVEVTGEQTVNVSPEEAVSSFVSGWSASGNVGYRLMLSGDFPEEGTCVIDDVKLVYIATYDHEKGNLPEMPLVYQIRGRLIYEDPEDGSEVVDEFTDYQYATK